MLRADGEAAEPVPLPTMVFAGWLARSDVVTRPVAVKDPVTVGDEIDGELARTGPPEPVALLPNPAETPVPRPETPVDIGSPVALVNVRDPGAPRTDPDGTVTVPVNVGEAMGA